MGNTPKYQAGDTLLTGLLKPDQCQVFLFTCPAASPFGFARHPWFVINRKGKLSRWEVFWRQEEGAARWGHLHKDFYAPTQGIAKYIFSKKHFRKDVRLLGYVEGNLAERMADLIESSTQSYPYLHHYSLKGPNSNTYAQWVIDRFPESNLKLPWNSFGKGAVQALI